MTVRPISKGAGGQKADAGPVVIVTGASRGIGAATCIELSRAGAVPVLFVRSASSALETVEAIRALGQACDVEPCDVANYDSVKAAIQRTLARHGAIGAVVNNAGQIDPIGRLTETDPANWAHAVQVNLVGAYHLAHAALPAMCAAGGGIIINLSSGAAHTARLGWSAYCSAKAGLYMLTRAIATEYGGDGVLSVGFQPGVVDTDMQGQIRKSGINEISKLRREDLASPQVVARAISWLCMEQPREFHGLDVTMKEVMANERAKAFISGGVAMGEAA